MQVYLGVSSLHDCRGSSKDTVDPMYPSPNQVTPDRGRRPMLGVSDGQETVEVAGQ